MQDLNIVIVDDDEVDIVAIKRALRKRKITNPIFVAHDGIEALELLHSENGPRWPYMILLDVNMPRMNGLEFLEALRADPQLHDAVVFMLSTSDDDRDMNAAYAHHVAGYVIKQNVGQDFMQLVELIDDFKLTVKFPVNRIPQIA